MTSFECRIQLIHWLLNKDEKMNVELHTFFIVTRYIQSIEEKEGESDDGTWIL